MAKNKVKKSDWEIVSEAQSGRIINDNMGQWKYPGEITRIQGNTMATHGYGDIPLYVIPNKGEPKLVLPNTGVHKFKGANSFTEYPIMQAGGRAPIITHNPNDPRLRAYQDSLDLYNTQNRFNAEYLSNFQTPPAPPPNSNNVDWSQLLQSIQNASPSRVYNDLINYRPGSNIRVVEPSQGTYAATNRQVRGFKIKPGNLIPNSQANSRGIIDTFLQDDTVNNYHNSIRSVNGNIETVNDYVDVDSSTLFGDNTTTRTFGYPHRNILHNTIRPVDTLRFHQQVPDARSTLNFESFLDPTSSFYNDANLVNVQLPVYARPVQPVTFQPNLQQLAQNPNPSRVTSSTTQTYQSLQPIRKKEQPINIQSYKPDLLQSNSQLEFNPIPFKKGTYFTRPRQSQEPNQNVGQFKDRVQGKTDYFDKKTGKLLGTYEYGGELPEAGSGYKVVRSNERKGKTHKVIGPDGTVKFFGDSKLGQHPKDPARKKAFYARHAKNLKNNPYFRAFARKTWAEGGELNDWEILDTAQEGKQMGYTWSTQQTPNYQPTFQGNYAISQTTGNRALTSKEMQANKIAAEKRVQQQKEAEYAARQARIKESIAAQNQPLSVKNIMTQSQSTGDKMSFAMNTPFGNPKNYPVLSGYMEGLDYINPFKFVGDMASGLGAVPYNVQQGNYGQAALSVAVPLTVGALAGIGTQGTRQFVNNLVNPFAGINFRKGANNTDEIMSLSAPKGNMYGENQVLVQQSRLLNPETKAKFFKHQAPKIDVQSDKFQKTPKDYDNRITPENYENFVNDIHKSTDYDFANTTGKQPHNLGIGNYGKPGMVYKDAPLNNLGKDVINAHEKNHGIFAGTLSREMETDLLKPFGTNKPVPHYAAKHQADEVLARMAQFKNAVGIGDNQVFTLGHLNLIRKNYANQFLDNGITEMLKKIPPGSAGEKKFLKNMNKYAFSATPAAVIGAGALQQPQQQKYGGKISNWEIVDDNEWEVLNEIPNYQQGGKVVSEIWQDVTGTPWSEAKKLGLTKGGYEENLAIRAELLKNPEKFISLVKEYSGKNKTQPAAQQSVYQQPVQQSLPTYQWSNQQRVTPNLATGDTPIVIPVKATPKKPTQALPNLPLITNPIDSPYFQYPIESTKVVPQMIKKPVEQPKKATNEEEEESTIGKIIDYTIKAPWTNPTEIVNYFETINDTRKRSKGENLTEAPSVQAKATYVPPTPITINKSTNKVTDTAPISLDPSSYSKIGFQPTAKNVYTGKIYNTPQDGAYATSVIDMSNGIKVAYQPRNEKSSNRSDVPNAVMVSDYLYDYDFTDNTKHPHAENSLNKLKQRVQNKDFETQKFVQVREAIPGKPGEYMVKVKPTSELTSKDFENNKIYRQSFAKLSDFDISPDGKKVKLKNVTNGFKNQGILYRDEKDNEHGLRVSGGAGNFGKYQNISELNQFGPYIGGTVTVISDDGKIAQKVTGSVKDILSLALEIKKKTGGKDVHFLQSDAGSMNVKALGSKSGLSKKQLGILRNLEPQAGASEILLK